MIYLGIVCRDAQALLVEKQLNQLGVGSSPGRIMVGSQEFYIQRLEENAFVTQMDDPASCLSREAKGTATEIATLLLAQACEDYLD